jgi:hypothetical protein
VQCCSVASDVAAVRIFAFFHPTEGTIPYGEQLTPEAWAAIVHTPAEDELSAGATAHALDIGAIERVNGPRYWVRTTPAPDVGRARPISCVRSTPREASSGSRARFACPLRFWLLDLGELLRLVTGGLTSRRTIVTPRGSIEATPPP